jgi:hypothetical protein
MERPIQFATSQPPVFDKGVHVGFGGCNIDTRTFFQDFWYFFMEQNFRIWRITPSGIFQVKSYSEYDESFVTTNYIAAR